jgi:hypothetical protein
MVVLPILIIVGFAGWLAGYFLVLPILCWITIACLLVGIVFLGTVKEMQKLVAAIFAVCAGIGNLVMWLTYYQATHQTWFGDFIKNHIFR